MKYLKRRLAVFLCAAVALTSALCLVPQTEVQAATWSFNTRFTNSTSTFDNENYTWIYNYDVEVDAGQTIDFKDYFYVTSYDSKGNSKTSSSGLKYTSDNKGVADISTAGILTTKKAGTAKLTVSYGTDTKNVTLKVYKAGTILKGSLKTCKSKVDAFVKSASKVKASNCYALYNTYSDLSSQVEKLHIQTYNGTLYVKTSGNSYYSSTNKIVIPSVMKMSTIYSDIYTYSNKYTPIGTQSSKWFKIKSVSGKASNDVITVTLKNKVTANQMFALQASWGYMRDAYIHNNGKATFTMIVQDKKTAREYYAVATVKKGSNKMTVRLLRNNLKKGTKYRLIGTNRDEEKTSLKYGWAKGKTFTCK